MLGPNEIAMLGGGLVFRYCKNLRIIICEIFYSVGIQMIIICEIFDSVGIYIIIICEILYSVGI